jgi:MFS family permease
LLPVLHAEWQLNNTEAGLVGGILFLGYVLAVPLMTAMTDRIDARRIYLGSALLAAAGSAFFSALADGLVGGLIGQVLFGIGFAGVFMPGLKALSDRVAPELQSRAVAMYMSLSGIGLSGSYFIAGWIAAYGNWRMAFALAAVGPVIAALLVFFVVPPYEPVPTRRTGLLASFGLVLRDNRVLGYTIGYVAHCWEVQGLRAWMVAFLLFVGSSTGALDGIDAAATAALISLGGIASSIGCNEFAKRLGRLNLIVAIMAAGLIFGIATGFSWRLTLWPSIALLAFYYANSMADAGALAAGIVAAAAPEYRGATLGVYSMLGYGAGLVAPTAFGLTLDLAGGVASGWAWAAAFIVLAASNLTGIVALRRLSGRAAVEPSTVLLAGGASYRYLSRR